MAENYKWRRLNNTCIEMMGYFKTYAIAADVLLGAIINKAVLLRGISTSSLTAHKISNEVLEKYEVCISTDSMQAKSTHPRNGSGFNSVEVEENSLKNYLRIYHPYYQLIETPRQADTLNADLESYPPGRPSVREICVDIFSRRRQHKIPLPKFIIEEARQILVVWPANARAKKPTAKTVAGLIAESFEKYRNSDKL